MIQYDSIEQCEEITEMVVWADVLGQGGSVLGQGGSVLGEGILNDVGQCNHGGVAGCGKADIVPGNRLDHLCGS